MTIADQTANPLQQAPAGRGGGQAEAPRPGATVAASPDGAASKAQTPRPAADEPTAAQSDPASVIATPVVPNAAPPQQTATPDRTSTASDGGIVERPAAVRGPAEAAAPQAFVTTGTHGGAPADATISPATVQATALAADPASRAQPTVQPMDTQTVPGLAAATPLAAPSVPQAAPATPQAAHTAPAAQAAPALLTLASSTTGSQHLTLRLEPAELGTVQIRIERPAESPVRVEISVARPETLTLMLRDQTQLQRALDQAGVPPEGRTLTFNLAGQDADSLSRQPGGFAQSGADGQPTPDATSPDDATDPEPAALPASPPLAGWHRAGLDITA
jgi:hypothetical protein